MSIQGQWFGVFKGSNSGNVIFNLDRRPGGFSGRGVALESDPQLPHETYAVTLRLDGATGAVSGHADRTGYFAVQNGKWAPIEAAKIRDRFPSLEVEATRAEVVGTFRDEHLALRFTTDAATFGDVSAVRSPVGKQSIIPIEDLTWDALKLRLSSSEVPQAIYRGQPHLSPLRTRFHRAGRFDIARFATEDVSRLGSAITSVTDTAFDLGDARIMGALLGLAQHHGFPTPLLDWTESPYVAAYFACREAIDREDVKPVVFVFDRLQWIKHNVVATDIAEPLPSLAFIQPLPLKNPRLLPQQSVLMYCNVDNFEKFVLTQGEKDRVAYLRGFRLTDNPVATLKDLRLMGVYAASMFPGLDGMCRGVFEQSLEF